MVANCRAKTALSRVLILVRTPPASALKLEAAALLLELEDGEALAPEIGDHGLLGVAGGLAGERRSLDPSGCVCECCHFPSLLLPPGGLARALSTATIGQSAPAPEAARRDGTPPPLQCA